MPHASFDRRYVWAACIMALGSGFAIAGHMSFILGFSFAPGPGYVSFVQTHGHVQLIGWAGLLIIGISLHVMPRMAGAPLAHPQWRSWILWLLAGGLALRAAGHPLVAYMPAGPGLAIVLWAVALSGALELLGIGLYIALMRRTIAGAPGQPERPALQPIRPYIQSMLLGWPLYAIFNLVLVTVMAWRGQMAVDAWWNDIAIRCFVGFVLLPVAFAFSVRFLPLYLRLTAPTWPVRRVAYVYLLGASLHIVALALSQPALMQAGRLVEAASILGFVWRLGIFTRGYLAWLGPASSRRPSQDRTSRQGDQAHHAFGAFEALIVSAYIWLTLAAAGELLSNLGAWTGVSANPDCAAALVSHGFYDFTYPRGGGAHAARLDAGAAHRPPLAGQRDPVVGQRRRHRARHVNWPTWSDVADAAAVGRASGESRVCLFRNSGAARGVWPRFKCMAHSRPGLTASGSRLSAGVKPLGDPTRKT